MAVSVPGGMEDFDILCATIKTDGGTDRVPRKRVHVDLVEAGLDSKRRVMNVRQHLPN